MSAWWRRPTLWAGLVVLVVGLFGIVVVHAPPTTWSTPFTPGPLVEDVDLRSLKRADHEIRLELALEDDARRTVLVRPTATMHTPARHAAGDVRLDVAPGPGPEVPDEALDALVAQVAARDAAWIRPPPYVAPIAKARWGWGLAQDVVLELLMVLLTAGLVVAAPAFVPERRDVPWIAATGGVLALAWWYPDAFDIVGPWHSNLHAYDRLADVATRQPGELTGLGRLHGHGWLVGMTDLNRLTGLDPFVLTRALWLVVLGVSWAWLRSLWQSPAAGTLGVAWMAATPMAIRLSGSVTMYMGATALTVLSLALWERHLRRDEGWTFALAMPAALIAMQTRTDILVLLPVWGVASFLLRKPGWFRTAWRRPAVIGPVVAGVLAVVPRLAEMMRWPPPPALHRARIDPVHDPRVGVLALAVLLTVAVLPMWRRGVFAERPTWRRGLAGVAVAAVVGWAIAVGMAWDSREPTTAIHAALDGGPLALSATIAGAAFLAMLGLGSRRGAWATAMAAGTAWLHLAQQDCLSTYVRTSLWTLPPIAAVVASMAVPRNAVSARWQWGASLLFSTVLLASPWASTSRLLTVRWPKQDMWALITHVRDHVAQGSTIVWPSEDDVNRRSGDLALHAQRIPLDRLLGGRWDVVDITTWRSRPVGSEAFFVRTTDCHRVPVSETAGQAALLADDVSTWSYLPLSRMVTVPRITIEGLDAGFVDPDCALVLSGHDDAPPDGIGTRAWKVTPLRETTVLPETPGTIHDILWGRPVLGLYRIDRIVRRTPPEAGDERP